MDIEECEEKRVPIKSMWLYPVRGVKGIKVDHLEVSPTGIKNDRIWCMLDKKTKKPVANHNSYLITYLRQVMKPETPNELKLVL